MKTRTALALLCCAALFPAPASAAAESALTATGLQKNYFAGARLLKNAERKGKAYVFRTLIFGKGALRIRLETSSPLDAGKAGRLVRKRLEIYRQIVSPSRLDYSSVVEREVEIKKEFRGEITEAAPGACPGYAVVIFPADADLAPVTSAGRAPVKMAVAGFHYFPPSRTLTEPVVYFPAAGFDRKKALAEFRGLVCGS